ncbi:hypothetical protein [uncultured Clostridium sp.]|uniref:hypothetical protein n=1 Tax=uncultured Clostridium sp. TaxID=59620 RepID=UPI0028E635FD|nr:hypothetical protein [uncultured Clostridium sp.]
MKSAIFKYICTCGKFSLNELNILRRYFTLGANREGYNQYVLPDHTATEEYLKASGVVQYYEK